MKVFKVSILLTLLVAVIAEDELRQSKDIEETQNNNEKVTKLILKKSEPGQEQTFFSKLKNWIFPGNNITPVPDSKAVAGHHVPFYVAPPRPIHPNRPDCDPCNKEPWIPIATNYGQNTLIGFVPQSTLNNGNGGPHQQYGVPNNNLGGNLIPPNPVSQNLVIIPPAQNFVQPSKSYGPPIQIDTSQLVPPPQYGPPLQYGPPQVGSPPLLGSPPQLGPPPQYGPPQISPSTQYGPPPQLGSSQLGSSPQFGPSLQLGPPPQINSPPQLGPPQLGPPQLGPPQLGPSQHGPPPQLGPPQHGPPPQLGPPIYGPPKPLPNKNYLPSLQNNFINRPQIFQKPHFVPRFVQKPSFPRNNFPIGMKPPHPSSFVTNYGVPPTSQIPFGAYGPPPQNYDPPSVEPPKPGPSDSYGSPLTGSNAQFALGVQNGKGYLPPPPLIKDVGVTPLLKLEEFDEILDAPDAPRLPLPLPNLNQYPMAPLRAPQNFLVDFHVDGQESRQNEVVNHKEVIESNQILSTQDQNVQIIPSISLANFVSSVEYPINVVQSPIVDVAVNPVEEVKPTEHKEKENLVNTNQYGPPLKLSQNPIVVDNYDNFPSSSNHNVSYTNIKDHEKDVESSFSNKVTEFMAHPSHINQLVPPKEIEINTKSPSVDYSNWGVSKTYLSSSMVPPTPGPSTWLTSSGFGEEITTTSKPNQIQIIIPYTKLSLKGKKSPVKEFEHKLSLYTLPPTTESEWLKYSETPTTPPEVINIKDFIRNKEKEEQKNFLPYDVLNFQKNIDDWTALEYSRNNFYEFKKLMTPSQNQSTSKEIPKNFFITKSYEKTTTPNIFDHEPAGSHQNENKVSTSFENFESNLIDDTTASISTTEEITTTTDLPTESTDNVTEEPDLNEVAPKKEKVYVVTPESLVRVTTPKSTIAFSHPPKIGGKSAKQIKDEYNSNLRLILSDWPHLINNLETTTNKSTSPHPLFGLMGISSYVNPKNATIETYSGHSKVITIVTPISVLKSDNYQETTTNTSRT